MEMSKKKAEFNDKVHSSFAGKLIFKNWSLFVFFVSSNYQNLLFSKNDVTDDWGSKSYRKCGQE